MLFTSVLVWAYSAPPLRTKRHGIWANVTIAIPRGMLLKVAGWSTVKTIFDPEPWFIGTIFGLFVLGASTTKDFADIEGDRAGGCQTLPILYGVKQAAWMIAPFFVLPFVLIPIGVRTGLLTGNPLLLDLLALVLVVYGIYTVYLLVRKPEELAFTENHPSWTHMYLMMMVAQVGFALAYVLAEAASLARPGTGSRLASATRPGASARRAARRTSRRLLRLGFLAHAEELAHGGLVDRDRVGERFGRRRRDGPRVVG